MAQKKRTEELWHRLSNETERSYEAFKVYLYMEPSFRNIHTGFRAYSGNPDAKKVPDYFQAWASKHAWQDRARAYDNYIESLRQIGSEEAILEEAKKQATQVESTRNRFNELMTVAYDRAMEWLNDSEWTNDKLKAQDVVKIISLHLEANAKLAPPAEAQTPGDWVEGEEDETDEEIDGIVAEVDEAAEEDGADEALGDEEEGISPPD